jgi:hypothetical protein
MNSKLVKVNNATMIVDLDQLTVHQLISTSGQIEEI